MKRSILAWVFAFALAVAGSVFAWLWFAGGSGEPSAELTTPLVASGESSTSERPPEVGSPVSFVIDPDRTTASFELDEELRGSPQRVVGTTDQVAGQVLIDISDLSTVQFSDIVINARTLQTDSERRDRAIRGPVILNSASDDLEFITFSVGTVRGLDGDVSSGGSLEFTVAGDLTIKGVANRETFTVSASLVDTETIEGVALASISRSAYDIGIPSVPGVANVSDEVILSLEFVLTAG